MNWCDMVAPTPDPLPPGRERYRPVENPPDDPHQYALDGRNGDYTKLQLMRMDDWFAKAMARAGRVG